MAHKSVLPFLAIALITVCSAQSHTERRTSIDVKLRKIRAILEEQQAKQHIPGLAFALIQNDQVFYVTLGKRNIERALPVTADTLFPIGSCTKAFTSMAAGRAQDKGLLSFDDHPQKYLPYFKMADADADAGVTIRDMLSHRTGLKAYGDLAAEPGVLTREEYVKAATSAKPVANFRSRFQYSNAMYSAAGEIVGKVNHSTWEQAVESDIFKPLGMASSVASMKEMAGRPDHVTGYVYDEASKSWKAVPPPASLIALAPGGSIASSARDMAKWLRMLSNGGVIGGKRFVSEATFRDLTSPKIAVDAWRSYAMGWVTYDWKKGVRVVEHNGGSSGISALVTFIPEQRVGFVFLANTSPNYMTKIGNAGNLLWPVILDEEPAPSTPPEVAHGGPETDRSKHSAPSVPSDLPEVDILLARMVTAAGGEASLRRHHSMEVHAVKSYENHGVIVDLLIRAKAPALREEEETWFAAGKKIAEFRMYFDGTRGGQETTFNQDSINDDKANQQALRDDDFWPLLDLKRLYPTIRQLPPEKVEGDEAYVLELTPAGGDPVRLYVSRRTGLVVQRDSEGQSTSFADYRQVDGEQVPFTTTIHDSLGETSIRIKDIRFNVEVPDAVFAPKK